MNLCPEIEQALAEARYDNPSKIQSYGVYLITTPPYETLVA
jgi:hypothetical protein